MQKVISINLNGNAYQVEEAGYDALITYLDSAHRQLRENPDRVEIVGDLEQAIAEKCLRYLGPHKTVVSAAEVKRILEEIGPVEGGDAAGPGATIKPSAAPRRLYRVPDGAMIAGVCNGIAAYAGIHPAIVRIVFVVLLVVTRGYFALAYFLLGLVLPQANTAEERAAAFGEPFSARRIVERATREHAHGDSSGTAEAESPRQRRQEWQRRREWRRRQRRRSRNWRVSTAAATAPTASYAARVIAGLAVALLLLVSVAIFWLWLTTLYLLVTRHEILGGPLPENVPLWVAVLAVMIVYQAVSSPLHLARQWSYRVAAGPWIGPVAVLDGLITFGIVTVTIWIGFRYLPEVREFLQTLPDVVRSFRDSFST